MKTKSHQPAPRRHGSALITVLIYAALSAVLLASLLAFSSNHGIMINRQNEFIRAQYAAEAGVEKTIAAMRLFTRSNGRAPSQSDLDNMSSGSFVPSAADNGSFSSYVYVTTAGEVNKIACTVNGTSTFKQLDSGPQAGLYGLGLPYRITSRVNVVQTIGRPYSITTGVRRDVEFQSIPIFQFAVFYNMDMEIENGPPMVINGRVHGNGNGYFAPDTSLTFNSNVTITKKIYPNPIPGDTHKATWNAPDYGPSATATEGSPSLNMPLYATPGANDAHDILEMPPAGTDPIAADRFYNKAGLRIVIKDSGSIITNTAGGTVTLPANVVKTSSTIFNYRENKDVKVTEIDVANLMAAGKVPANGIVYVVDQRTTSSSQQTSVRLVNGSSLPNGGLTVATPNPIYVKGDYNTANRPASIMGDAINILSNAWNDSNASSGLGSRIATPTTVNAAFFSGIVPTDNNNDHYSGGLENFPRFHEDWSGGVVFTYSGSMVAMFSSETATGIWGNSSYSPPNRNWSFNVNFLDPTLLPPGTPSVLLLVRARWTVVP